MYRFGGFELSRDRYELRMEGDAVRLEPRVFEVLAYLVVHRNRVVSKDELLERIWPQQYVTQSALTRAVREVRRVLKDDAADPSWVTTVYGRGYRFIGAVQEAPEAPPAAAAAPASARPAAPTPAAAPARATPTSRPARDQAPFVGRERELAALRGLLAQALAGSGRLVLLAGEPGIGKTRTAQAIASEAEAKGARVLWGKDLEDWPAPSYWVWVQAIRSYVEDVDPEVLLEEMGAGAADIAEIVPEVRKALPGLAPAPTLGNPDQARFRLFDSVTRFLRRAAQRQPLVLILDNLHWTGKPSLLLLEFLAQELKESRILVVGTYREQELSRRHPLLDTLGELGREGHFERLPLCGLDRAEVRRFIRELAATDAPDPVVEAVYRQTDGNPFYVGEVVRLLLQEGRLTAPPWEEPRRPHRGSGIELGIPKGVREVIGRRLNRLSPLCNATLGAAAVIGREFSLQELQQLGDDLRGEPLLEVVEEAVAAGVLQEIPQAIGRYQFTHALIRETLYDELGTARRVREHRRIAAALEHVHSSELNRYLPQIAHHYFEAAQAGAADKAIEYAARAGEQAMGMLAFEEAAGFFDRALETMELAGAPNDELRFKLLLRLGQARRRGGETGRALHTFLDAAAVARRLGSASALAEAALAFGRPGGYFALHAEPARRLLEEALAGLAEEQQDVRARLLAGLAGACYLTGQLERGDEASRAAVELAREVGEPATLLAALSARLGGSFANSPAWQSEEIRQRLADSEEVASLAQRLGEPQLLMDGQAWLLHLLLDLGDVERFRREISTYQDRAVSLRQPVYLFLQPLQAAMLATMEGRFSAAERFAREAHTVGKRLRVETAAGMFAMQMFLVRWLQGRLAELAPAVERFLAASPASSVWRPGLAIVLLEMGREAEARAEVERLTAGGSADVPFDVLWISSIAFLSEVAARAGAHEAAETLYRLLSPRAGGTVTYGGVFGCLGSTHYFLGQLAASLQRRSEAERHYEAALKLNARLGARPWVALTQERLAALLLERGRPSDLARAGALREQALDAARELGMHGLARRLGAAERPEERPGEPASPSELSRREVEVLLQIATGRSNREIAAELGISLSTVATHLRNILAKTGARNRTEAAAFAHRRGLS